jgi:hypothetical protein
VRVKEPWTQCTTGPDGHPSPKLKPWSAAAPAPGRLDLGQGGVQALPMSKLVKLSVFGLAVAVWGLSSSAFACGGEGKDEKDEPAPSALCGGEGKDEKDEPAPSALCGGEGKDEKDEPAPSVL